MGKEKFMRTILVSILGGIIIGISATTAIIHATKKEIRVSCPQPVCPKCPPNSIDIEKLKDFRGKFIVNQSYEISSDSNFRQLIIKDIEQSMMKLKLSKCR